MRILYGVQGTGNGHLSRARIMAKAFKGKAVEVDFFSLVGGRRLFLICRILVTIKSKQD